MHFGKQRPSTYHADIYRQMHALCRLATQENHNHHIRNNWFSYLPGVDLGISIEAFRDNLFPTDWGLMQQPVGNSFEIRPTVRTALTRRVERHSPFPYDNLDAAQPELL